MHNMTEDDNNTNRTVTRWFVDLKWYSQRERAITALLQSCLCDACRKKLSKGSSPPSDSELIDRLRECCQNSTGFITGQRPLLESIFRFLIASGNEPLTVAELARQLSERRSGDASRTSEETLLRLLKNDRYYGFRPVAD